MWVGVPRVTLQTIADEVGVSRMTVSNAFSRPDQLSAAMRGRILEAAERLGYVGPDPAARGLVRGTTGTVGVLLTDSLDFGFTDEVATTFLGAIAEELAPTGLSLTLLSAAAHGDVIPARDVAMDGALVYSCNPESNAVELLQRRKLPLVFIDQVPVKGVSSINIEDRKGAGTAAQHLVDLGHEHVGILTTGFSGAFGLLDDITGLPDGFVLRERLRGWTETLDKAAVRTSVLRYRHGSDEEAYQAARVLLDGADRPTGVLCFSDRTAREVVQAAQDLGLEVPRDVSVVGFDDNPLACRMRPALTTIRQDISAKGHAAAQALTRALENARKGGTSRPRHIELPTELVVRDSTAPPRR